MTTHTTVPSDKLDAFIEIIQDYDQDELVSLLSQIVERRPELMDMFEIDRNESIQWAE